MNLPPIGFGTSPYRANGARVDIEPAVRIALAAGYRLFDLAEMYGNERAVGRALGGKAQVIGKAWRTNFRPEHLKRACKDSLQRIGIDAFDLYLLHAPEAWRHVAPLDDVEDIGWDELTRRAAPGVVDDVPLPETWEAMRGLLDAGLAKQIGVSNFVQQQIDALGEPRPFANEIPCWPLASSDIPVIGYSPLKNMDAPLIKTIAAAHARTPAQVILRFLTQRGIVPLTSSVNPDHIRESLGALDFELDAAEVDAIVTATR